MANLIRGLSENGGVVFFRFDKFLFECRIQCIGLCQLLFV